jgi:hypothetical protein
MGNFNTLGYVSISLLPVATFLLVVYIGFLISPCSDPEKSQLIPYCKGMSFFKYAGIVLLVGAYVCLILNRTSWLGSASKGNWANAYFYSGIIILIAAFLICIAINYFSSCEELLPQNTSGKLVQFSMIALFLTAGWLLMVPDL